MNDNKRYYYKVLDKDEGDLLEYCCLPYSHEDNEYFYFIEITESDFYNVVNTTYGWFAPLLEN